jgi:hypothetical protein
VLGSCEHSNELLRSIKHREFLGSLLRTCQHFLKKDYAPWSHLISMTLLHCTILLIVYGIVVSRRQNRRNYNSNS